MFGLFSLATVKSGRLVCTCIGWLSCRSQYAGNHSNRSFHHVPNLLENDSMAPRVLDEILPIPPESTNTPLVTLPTRLMMLAESVSVPTRAFPADLSNDPKSVNTPTRLLPTSLVNVPKLVSVPASNLPTRLVKLPALVNVPATFWKKVVAPPAS